jgi:hypothetical protein
VERAFVETILGGMDEEAKQLLREIRDLMAASPARYEQALAENKRVYEEYLSKMRRSLGWLGAIIGAGVAALFFSR